MDLTHIEASFFKYLYENLELTDQIKILEDIRLQDFEGLTKWVVIDSLTNRLGDQPKQLWFLHIAVHKAMAHTKVELIRLCDKVEKLLDVGTEIQVYDYDSHEAIGTMTVSETSLSPAMPHFSGGMFRSMTVGVVYAA
jgi:hypothetical protein